MTQTYSFNQYVLKIFHVLDTYSKFEDSAEKKKIRKESFPS